MNAPLHTYRADVDGLRAVAVLAVIGFHAFPHSVPGGFVGVDVFFVISGFLITGIILEAVDKDRFTFTDFYIRRIRRIFPALSLVLIACLIAGWLMMLPNDYSQIGKHVFGGSTFISNLLLYFETDYFDSNAGYKPLLHLWSLGVEEQYYLFWPVLLYFCRGHRSHAMRMIVGIGLASFALNIYLVKRAPEAAFYLPVTRFWELMLGSALAVMKRDQTATNAESLPQRYRTLISLAGAVAVAISVAVLDSTKAFPGWWALPVAGGTTAIIWAGPSAWLNRHVLALRPMVLVGLISYPLYMWHWPLISFSWQVYGWQVPTSVRIAMVLLSFVLAWLTYRFVEIPIRKKRPRHQVVVVTRSLAATVAVLGMVGLLGYTGVFQAKSASDSALVAIAGAVQDGTSPEGAEVIQGANDSIVLFIGDSHMAQYRPRLEKLAAERPFDVPTIELHTHGGCPPLPSVERAIRGYCSKVMTAAFERAKDPAVTTVVIGAAWIRLESMSDFYVVGKGSERPHRFSAAEIDEVLSGFSDRLASLRKAGKHVVVLTSSPSGDFFDPRLMLDRSHIVPVARYRALVPRQEATQATKGIDAKIRRAALRAGVTIVDPSQWICPNDLCPSVDAAGRPISADGWHLRPYYVREHLSAVDDLVKPITRRP